MTDFHRDPNTIPSALPADYGRAADFTDYEIAHPGDNFQGADLDAEFNAVGYALAETQDRLALIQNDDGTLGNQSVHPQALAPEALKLIGAGWTPRGAWQAGGAYQAKDVVVYENLPYVAVAAHTAGNDFMADLTAGLWLVIGAAGAVNDLIADLASDGPGKGAALVNYENGLTLQQYLPSDNIKTLTDASYLRIDGLQIETRAFYADTDTGGGRFYWDAARDKATANGGTVIDPDTPGGYDGTTTTLATYLSAQGTGTGTGCWVRLDAHPVNVRWFGALGDGVTSDEAAFEACVAYCQSVGDSTLAVPLGDYPVRIAIDTGGIAIRCTPGTVLRPSGPLPIIEVMPTTSAKTILSDARVTGQTRAQEGTDQCEASHGVRVEGPNLTCIRLRVEGFRYDCLYGNVDGQAGFRSIDCDWGDTARNSVSLVGGFDWRFVGGSIWNKGQYLAAEGYQPLYLFDIEPTPGNPCAGVYFSGVRFLSGSLASGANQLIIGGPQTTDGFSHVTLNGCEFDNLDGAGNIATIRVNSDITSGPIQGVVIRNSRFAQRLFANPDAAPTVLQYTTLADLTLGAPAFYAVSLGDGCTIENVRRRDGVAVNTAIEPGAAVTVRNVAGQPNLFSGDTQLDNALTQSVQINAIARIEARPLSVTDTANWTSILTLGTRGTFKITIGGSDASSGNAGLHASESWCVVSGDRAHKPPINIVYNLAGAGLDVRWEDAANGTGIVYRTLQVKPQAAGSNQYAVRVDIISQYADAGAVTWLV